MDLCLVQNAKSNEKVCQMFSLMFLNYLTRMLWLRLVHEYDSKAAGEPKLFFFQKQINVSFLLSFLAW